MKTQHNWMHRLLMLTVLLLVCTIAFVSCDGDDTPSKHEHTVVVDAAVEATCKTTGLTEGAHCPECGEILVAQETVELADHSAVTDAAVEATCTTTGLTEGSHCSVCGEILVAQEDIGIIDHTIVIDKEVPADCKNTGLTAGAHCSECGKVFAKQEVIPVSQEHTYDDRYDAVCNICEHTRDVDCAHFVVEKLPSKDATCNEFGLTEGTKCVSCGETIVAQEIIEKKPHIEGEWIVDKEPTATETGKKRQVCTMCGETLQEVTVPVLKAFEYTVNSDGISCTITGIALFNDSALYIPEHIDGYKVTAIGDKAFAERTQLTAIIIPETVTSIGTRAFYGCTGLTEITIPASVTSIGTQIFYKASNLSTVYYNSTYSSLNNQFLAVDNIIKVVFGGNKVPNYILKGCTGVKEVEIRDSVKSIGEGAFYGCSSITSIVIPNGVTSISNHTFYECNSLTSIVIPNGVISIGRDAFYSCHSLTSVVIPNRVTIIGDGAFRYCRSLASIVIPNGVTSIGSSMFDGCSSLTSIVIPDSITSIGNYAFRGCSSLKSIYITDIEAWCNISFGSDYTYPMLYGADLYLNGEVITNLVIPQGITSINNYAFYRCDILTSIEIPNSVTSIGDYAFYECGNLTSINFAGTIEQWRAIDKYSDTFSETGDYIIYCTDGTIAKNGDVVLFDPTAHDYTVGNSNEDGHWYSCRVDGCTSTTPIQPHEWSDWMEYEGSTFRICYFCEYKQLKTNS